ncbi:T9SS type A sorting domain-containing protein [Winogradskyella wichelsiae]|uniref:T9SS type A sorting domain-containing protein n=1 Tax=Winogradskyella wichelsiae TaxID=2697007 RepID=UPI0015CE99C2|nr:T9SS type A sorting domain-containing protein [Winogradskyella wichelsiae]
MKAPTKIKKPLYLFLLVFILSGYKICAQEKAFPSAFGAGANVSGGRGKPIYFVNNLNSTGLGSFRQAISDAGVTNGGNIVFNVSGTIELEPVEDWLTLNVSNLSIWGQTAPQGGITITGTRIKMQQCNNVIIRYLRIRPDYSGSDAFEIISSYDVILDHVSINWGGDESVSTRSYGGQPTYNITFQRLLVAESKTGTLFGNTGAPSEAYDLSIHNSLYFNVSHRHPNLFTDGRGDIINNVVWDWQARLSRIGGNGEVNMINNYYGMGSRNNLGNEVNCIDTNYSPSIYAAGNYIDKNIFTDPEADNKVLYVEFNLGAQDVPAPDIYFNDIAYPLLGVPVEINAATDSFTDVINDVGANAYIDNNGVVQRESDFIDDDYLEVINLGEGSYETYENSPETFTSQQRYLDFHNNVSHIALSTRPDNYDENGNGIADTWESNYMNGASATDTASSGYTWFEEFVNQVDNYNTIAAESVTLTPNTTELALSDTLQISVNFIPVNTTNQNGTWTSSNQDIATVSINGLVTPISVGEVIITFRSIEGELYDATEITVFPEALQASASNDQQICHGESVILTASGGASYLWNTGDITESIEVSPEETTVYSVSISDNYDQVEAIDIMVSVNAMPTAYAGEDQFICFGSSTVLTATGGTSYTWNTGETTASIEVSPTEETIYSVEVSDNFCSSIDDVVVIVNAAPEVSVSDDIVIIEGESTTLSVTGSESYIWSTGETTTSILVAPIVTTAYTVTSIGENGCISNEEVTVTVIPEMTVSAGEDITICSGESITLSASGGSIYTWSTDQSGAEISVSPTITTTYTVTGEDDYGFTNTDEVTVFVNDMPTITVNEDLFIMIGSSVTLSANGGSSYLWSTGDTISEISVSPENTTIYSVTGFSENGCQDTVEVTVTVLEELNANAGEDVAICLGESVILNASGGSIYHWSTGETEASINVNPIETTTYTVTVFDNLGRSDSDTVTVNVNALPVISVSENINITEGESTVLTANGALTYLWNTGEVSNSITVSPLETTTYSVVGTSDSCNSEIVEIVVTVIPSFEASAGVDSRVCDNESYEVILTANEGDSYLWSTGETTQSITVNPLSTTSYTVVVSQGEQTDSDDVTVYVDPSPEVVIANGENVDILNGDFVTLSVSGANTYEWNNGGSQPNLAVGPSITTVYEVKGFVGQCYDQKQVIVNVLQPVVADAGEDVLICLNELVTLSASGGDDYLWSTGETTQNISVSPIESTDYSVTVFNDLDFDEATVSVEIDSNCSSGQPVDDTDEVPSLSLHLYPNPAEDIVNIKISGSFIISNINIIDVTGKLVHHSKVNNENLSSTLTEQIDVSALQSGVYFIKLEDQSRVVTKKLIVN